MKRILKLPMLGIMSVITLAGGLLWAPNAQALVATYYNQGAVTASGEPFDPNGMTAAHPSLPFGTLLTVCKDSCRTVKVNDRGPFGGNAGLDLSEGAAKAIGLDDEGVADISVSQAGSTSASAAPLPPAQRPPVAELPKTGGISFEEAKARGYVR